MKIEPIIGIAAGIATIAIAIVTWRQVKAQSTTSAAATAARTYNTGFGSTLTAEQQAAWAEVRKAGDDFWI